MSNLDRLPPICAVLHPTQGRPVLLVRGKTGYWPAPRNINVESFNQKYRVTPAQREAMLAGSMFGFHCPAADPDNQTHITE